MLSEGSATGLLQEWKRCDWRSCGQQGQPEPKHELFGVQNALLSLLKGVNCPFPSIEPFPAGRTESEEGSGKPSAEKCWVLAHKHRCEQIGES